MARRTPPPSTFRRFQALLASNAGRWLTRIGLGAVAFLLVGLVMQQARAYAHRLEGFRLTPASIEIVGLPAWADARIQEALKPAYFRPLSISVFDPRAEQIVQDRIESHPLVRRAYEVRVLYPDRAQVCLTLRVPVARVVLRLRRPDGSSVQRARLLSEDGCLLPAAPYASYVASLALPLPTVVGIRAPAPRRPGEVWEDRTERVLEAVAAAALGRRLARDFQGRVILKTIDVSRFPATDQNREGGEVRLVVSCPPTRRGGPRVERTLDWGRTERARASVSWEEDYATKLGRLRNQLTAPNPPAFIDVRWALSGATR